jgi:hypothetical protein
MRQCAVVDCVRSTYRRKIIEKAEMAVETMETVAAFYRDTRLGRKLRAEAREELLAALLVERFGEDPEVAGVAHRLASWENSARAGHAITTATSLQDLEDLEDAQDDADSAQ